MAFLPQIAPLERFCQPLADRPRSPPQGGDEEKPTVQPNRSRLSGNLSGRAPLLFHVAIAVAIAIHAGALQ
jgi:hypothetical protein